MTPFVDDRVPRRAGTLLLRGGDVLSMAEGDVPTRADVLVVDGRIAAVEASIDPPGSVEVVDVSGCFVLPGGIQAHTHLGQALFRGLAEDRELLRWLRERIWPLEAAHDEESAYVSAALCLVDALASGTTTIQDMGLSFHTEALARACEDLGVRALLGPCLMDTGYDGLARTTDDALTAAESFAARPGRTWVRPILCPRFILSCTPALWRGVVDLAGRLALAVHTHLLEHPAEEDEVRAVLGRGQMAFFDEIGVLDTDLRVAHCVQLGASDAAVLGARPLKIAHCPSANLKLGSGVADLGFLARLPGVTIGIGCDGAPCNNDMDLLEEVRLAALLQQWRQGPGRFPARTALALATRTGAATVGLSDEIGTIEPGKRGDLVVLDLAGVRTFGPPPVAVEDRIVYAAGREHVRHVVVDGTFRIRDRRVVGVDTDRLVAAARDAVARVCARARIV